MAEIRNEVMHLRVRAEALEADVKQKDKEIEVLNQRLEDQSNIYSSSLKSEDKLKVRRDVRRSDGLRVSLDVTQSSLHIFLSRKHEMY